MALLETLVDNFATNTLATKWPSSVNATISSGHLNVPCNTGFDNATSAASYTLNNSYVYAIPTPAAAASATVEAVTEMLVLTTTAGTDAGFSYNAVTGNVSMVNRVGYTDGSATTFAYSSTTHRYWRLRASGGTIFWDTSTDGLTWTNRRSTTAPAWVSNSNLALTFSSHRNNGTNNTALWDSVNYGPVMGTLAAGSGAISPTITGKRLVHGTATGSGGLAGATITGHRAVYGAAAAALSIHPHIDGLSSAVVAPTPAPVASWQFLTGPASGGYQQELTAAKSRKFVMRLNGHSETSFTLDARISQADDIDELQTDVHVNWRSAAGVLHRLLRARVNQSDHDGGDTAHTMSISALSYKAVLDNRVLLDGVAQNLNPGFQDGLTGWTGAGGTLTVDESEAHTGGKSGRITPDGVTANVTITSDLIEVTANGAVRVAGWVRNAVARNVDVRIDWKDAGTAAISSTTLTVALAATEWTRVDVDATAPATAVYARLVAAMGSTPAATDVLWVDDLRLTFPPTHASRLRFDQIDQAEIAWDLISDSQDRTAGDLGISPTWTGATPTGQLRDRQYEIGDSIGQRIQELSEVIDGFDWDITPISPSALALEVWSPERGVNRGVILEYGGLVARFKRSVQPGEYANSIRMTGADSLDAQEREAEDLASNPAGRWDRVFGDTGLTTQTALDERAHWQMKESQFVPTSWSLTLRPGGWQGPDHIWLGDTVRLIVYSGTLRVDTTLRVTELAFDIGDGGTETVEVTLGGPKPDYRRFRSKTERRLTNLERR